ncbi:hypothetical protein ACFL6C_08920 [Myxococcota bacterium]
MLEVLQNGGRRIRDAFGYAFNDPAWAMRYGTAAILLLIPVVGYLALLGWQVRVYECARLGRRMLPRPELINDVRRGVPMFVNLVCLFVVPILLAILVALPLDALGISWQRYVGPEVLQALFVVLVFVSYPELLRRSLVYGERFVLLKPIPSIAAVSRAPLAFLFTVVGTFVAYLVAAFGIYAFVVGILFTAPIGHAMAAYLVMEWHRDLEA